MFIKNFEKISKQFSVSINDYECFFDLPTILSELMCSAPPKLSHVFRRCTSEFKWIHFNSFNPLTTPPPLLCWEGGIELATKFKF